jgi:UDP-N-acetylglucosamine 4,6-dehydratase
MNLDLLKGKTVLVTGGTGSFGKNFCKYILENSELKKLIVFSRDELKQSVMEAEIKDERNRLRFFLGDVRDLPRLLRAFHGVDIIVHAAALKQVPALEYNPFEAVKTNILGSQNVIEAALDRGVEKVLLVSTDKAAMPVNLYGSTKLCAEKLFVAANLYGGHETKFSVVRYGNVVGSRGSIVEHLIRNKDASTVYITDERMTRFWLDLDQAFRIVLFGLGRMEGGEIFVPKALTMKVSDLFDIIVPDAKREVSGIRPGEKLHEVLLTREEARHAVELDDYFVVLPEWPPTFWDVRKIKRYHEEGKQLKPDFHFSSDGTMEPMSKEELLRIVALVERMVRA